MKLLTKALEKQLPPLYETEKTQTKDKLLICKFFLTGTAITWYACEYDLETKTFFGLVDNYELEWGYFSLEELEGLKGQFNMPVERDLYFEPTKYKDLNTGL